jgi:hypothetical protein
MLKIEECHCLSSSGSVRSMRASRSRAAVNVALATVYSGAHSLSQ